MNVINHTTRIFYCVALCVAVATSVRGQERPVHFPPVLPQRVPSALPQQRIARLPWLNEPAATQPLPPTQPIQPTRQLSESQQPRHIAPAIQPEPAPRAATFDHLTAPPAGPVQATPPGFTAWWSPQVGNRLSGKSQPMPVDLRTLLMHALEHSARIRAVREDVAIRQQGIVEAASTFDPTLFMESRFTRTNEPVGNTLTTGGPDRFKEQIWNYKAGLKKKTALGGQLEVSQDIGSLDNNSIFLEPPRQGNAQLTLSYEQPLLNGAGIEYNNSLIVLAEIDTAVAVSRTTKELQDHLQSVANAYWDLYLQRAAFVQKQRSFERATSIFKELSVRQAVDASKSQIVRARSAVEMRRAELARAAASIRNAESRIRALVNHPGLRHAPDIEMIPAAAPIVDYMPVTREDALVTALSNRPEIGEATQQLDAASVRLKMSKNEMLPTLSLVVESYVNGLRGGRNIGTALQDQFDTGGPSYSAGITGELPIGNRAARSRKNRRQAELRKLSAQYEELVANLSTEVEVAVRDVQTTHREIAGRYSALRAAHAEREYLEQRWRLLPGDDRSASFLLEDLLDAQERLASAEFTFVQAKVDYAKSQMTLKRSMGVLLQHQTVTPQRAVQPAPHPAHAVRGANRPRPIVPSHARYPLPR